MHCICMQAIFACNMLYSQLYNMWLAILFHNHYSTIYKQLASQLYSYRLKCVLASSYMKYGQLTIICHYFGSYRKTDYSGVNSIFSVPEIKVLILAVYFIIFSTVLSTRISLTIEYSNNFFDNLYTYFYCQLRGDNSACDRLKEEYEQLQDPHVTSLIILMLGLITCANLIFAVQVQDVRDLCSRVTRRIELTCTRTRSTSASNVA